MNPQENFQEQEDDQVVPKVHILHTVTPLSKYLAMALFIILPFIGGWIGYSYSPEKIVEVTVIKEVEVSSLAQSAENEGDSIKKSEKYTALWAELDSETHKYFTNESGFLIGEPYSGKNFFTFNEESFFLDGLIWTIDSIGTSTDEQARIDKVYEKMLLWENENNDPGRYNGKRLETMNTTGPGGREEVLTYTRVDDQLIRMAHVLIEYDEDLNTSEVSLFLSRPVDIEDILSRTIVISGKG